MVKSMILRMAKGLIIHFCFQAEEFFSEKFNKHYAGKNLKEVKFFNGGLLLASFCAKAFC